MPELATSYPAMSLSASPAGLLELHHVADGTYRVSARCKGFQPLVNWKGLLSADQPTVIPLIPAPVVTGVIVDEHDQPAVGVDVVLWQESRMGQIYYHGGSANVWATTIT